MWYIKCHNCFWKYQITHSGKKPLFCAFCGQRHGTFEVEQHAKNVWGGGWND